MGKYPKQLSEKLAFPMTVRDCQKRGGTPSDSKNTRNSEGIIRILCQINLAKA